jgi:hypothetical protein
MLESDMHCKTVITKIIYKYTAWSQILLISWYEMFHMYSHVVHLTEDMKLKYLYYNNASVCFCCGLCLSHINIPHNIY